MQAAKRAWPAATGNVNWSWRSQAVKRAAIAGSVNERPPFVDFTYTTALSWARAPRPLFWNCLQATYTAPLRVTAMSQNWLPTTARFSRRIENVRPPSVERAKKIWFAFGLKLKRAQQR